MKNKVAITILICFLILQVNAQHRDLKTVDVTNFKELSNTKISSEKRPLIVQFDPSGTYLAVGGLDKKITVFNIGDGSQVWQKAGTEYEPIASANLPGNTSLLITAQNEWAGGKIFLFDWKTGENKGTLSPYAGGRTGLSYFQNSFASKIAWAGPDGKLFEYDLIDHGFSTLSGWKQHEKKANSVCHGPYGNLISGGFDGTVLKNNENDPPSPVMKFEHPVLCVTGNYFIKGAKVNAPLIAAGDNKGNVMVKYLNEKDIFYSSKLGQECKYLKFHPTDPSLLFIAMRQHLFIVDFIEGEILKELAFDEIIWAMDITSDGKKLALGLESGKIKLYRL